MADAQHHAETGVRGDAYGSDPTTHAIRGGVFVCTAGPDAPCRTSPTCECESWCCCDGSPEDAVDNHGEGEHCCMTTAKPGAECWIGPWVDAAGLSECYADGDRWPMVRVWEETSWPDGAVICDWADGVFWAYAEPTTPPGSPTEGAQP